MFKEKPAAFAKFRCDACHDKTRKITKSAALKTFFGSTISNINAVQFALH